MARLTTRFDAEEYLLVKRQAQVLGISLAEFVRRAIRDKLLVSKNAPWMRYVGMVSSGDPNSSLSIDEIVYGSKQP
jgi:hypothetical protein